MVLMNIYGNSYWFYHTIVLVSLHIVFFIVIIFVEKILKNSAFKVFSPFIYTEHSEKVLSKFSLLKPSSSIRIIAEYNSDPFVLKRILDHQKQTNFRTSSFIEICRFLSLFPNFRMYMKQELESFTTKSVYNKYILYMFKFILDSFIKGKISENLMKQIEYFYSNFIAHSYLYWNARKNKKYVRSFFEAFYCAYLSYEEKNLIHGLFKICPKDPILHKYLAEMLLNMDGKYESYQKEILFSIQLIKDNNSVVDPLLHEMSIRNPKILQFCNSGRQLSISNSYSSSEIGSIKSSSLFKKSRRKKKNKKDIASKIDRSNRKIPYLHILNFILPSLIILAFNIYTDIVHFKDVAKSENLKKSIELIDNSFNIIASSVFIPLSLRKFTSNITTDESICMANFFSITNIVSDYLNSPIISNFDDSIVNAVFHEMRRLVLISSNVCSIVNNFPSFLKKTVYENVLLIRKQEITLTENIGNIYQREEKLFDITYFIGIGNLIVICFLTLYFIVNCISLNSIMSKNENAIEYLSSEKRLNQIFQKPESRDSFWFNSSGIESSNNNSDSSLHLDYESDFETTSNLSTSVQNSRNLRMYQQQMRKQTIRPTSSATHIMKNSPSDTKLNKSGDTDLINENNKRQKIGLSNSSLSRSSANFTSKKNMIPRPNSIIKNFETDDSILSDNPKIEIKNIEDNNENNENNNIDDNIIDNINMNNDYEAALQLSNENAISEFLSDKKKDTIKFGFYIVIIIILFPWIFFYLILCLSFSPLKFRRKTDFDIVEELHLYINDFKNAFSLLDETLSILYKGEANFTIFQAVNQSFSKKQTILADLYFEIQCFQFSSIECFSVNSIVDQLYEKNYSQKYLELYAVPFLANFTKVTIENLFSKSLNQLFALSSHSVPFLIIVIAFCIIFIIIGFVKTKNLRKGLNSLFHFPGKENQIMNQNELKTEINEENNNLNADNINDNNNENNNNLKLSENNNNNLSMISLLENNSSVNLQNINNSSPNIQVKNNNNNNDNDPNINLLESQNNNNKNDNSNIKLTELKKNKTNENSFKDIDTKNKNDSQTFQQNQTQIKQKLFPSNVMIVTSVAETDEIYSISDSCVSILGKKPTEMICRKISHVFPLIKSAEDYDIREYNGRSFISKTKTIGKLSKTVLIEISKAKMKNVATNTIQKLINFIPFCFLKSFSEEFSNFFLFENIILLFVRINTKSSQIDNFFNTLSRLDQSFFSVDCIRANGSILAFVCTKIDALEISLFLRDLIVAAEDSCRRQMANYALKSVLVCGIDHLCAQIIEGDIEPEVHFDEKEFFEYEKMSFLVDDMSIGCTDEILEMLKSIGIARKIVKKNNINMMHFKSFSDQIASIL